MQTVMTDSFTCVSEVLSSWKEIAQYVNRGVRTVQRWEEHLSFPIHRPAGRSHSAVIALRSEVDAWLKACPLEIRQEASRDERANTSAVLPATRELLLRSRQLRHDMVLRRHQCSNAVNELVASLEKMMSRSGSNVDTALMLEVTPPRETEQQLFAGNWQSAITQ